MERSGKRTSKDFIKITTTVAHYQRQIKLPNRTNRDLNAPFTQEELDRVIDKLLKYGKAAGYDRIKAEFLKAAPKTIREIILRLMNKILASGIVPKGWCIGILNLIHKEGPKDNPDNYRGICISSALSKTLSTMMNVRLTNYISERKLVDKGQIGFTEKNRFKIQDSRFKISFYTQLRYKNQLINNIY